MAENRWHALVLAVMMAVLLLPVGPVSAEMTTEDRLEAEGLTVLALRNDTIDSNQDGDIDAVRHHEGMGHRDVLTRPGDVLIEVEVEVRHVAVRERDRHARLHADGGGAARRRRGQRRGQHVRAAERKGRGEHSWLEKAARAELARVDFFLRKPSLRRFFTFTHGLVRASRPARLLEAEQSFSPTRWPLSLVCICLLLAVCVRLLWFVPSVSLSLRVQRR